MAIPVIMPKFGMAQENATIVRWLKREGEAVEQGDPLVEVATDKVNMEVEASARGILRGIRFGENEMVAVTETIAYLVAPNEPPPFTPPSSPVAQRIAADADISLREIQGTGIGGRVMRADVERHLEKMRATPAARRAAREKNLPLENVVGTGPRGRIQQEDVLRAAENKTSAQWIPFEGMRGAIARRMQASYQTAPHIHLTLSVDVTQVEAARARWRVRRDQDISLTAVLVKACAWALRRHPRLNATVHERGIEIHSEINVGVAVALDDGLIVVVVPRADTRALTELAEKIADRAERARENKLRPNDLENGTFTLTNLGRFGIESFDPILNPPQAAILGVGAITETPVRVNENIEFHPKIQLTLAADHRAVDGAVAAKFLQEVKAVLEEPMLLLL